LFLHTPREKNGEKNWDYLWGFFGVAL
jgi:hypothetical protein